MGLGGPGGIPTWVKLEALCVAKKKRLGLCPACLPSHFTPLDTRRPASGWRPGDKALSGKPSPEPPLSHTRAPARAHHRQDCPDVRALHTSQEGSSRRLWCERHPRAFGQELHNWIQQVWTDTPEKRKADLCVVGVLYLSWQELDRSWCYRPAAPEASAAADNARKAGPAGHSGQSASAPLRHRSRCTAEGDRKQSGPALPDATDSRERNLRASGHFQGACRWNRACPELGTWIHWASPLTCLIWLEGSEANAICFPRDPVSPSQEEERFQAYRSCHRNAEANTDTSSQFITVFKEFQATSADTIVEGMVQNLDSQRNIMLWDSLGIMSALPSQILRQHGGYCVLEKSIMSLSNGR